LAKVELSERERKVIMQLGLQVTNFTWPDGQAHLGDTFGLFVQRAERAGFASLWVMDHFLQSAQTDEGTHPRPVELEMLEAWSALAFAAARTNRIKLGTLVTGVTYRHPGILVKMATTLDVLSHGRAYFGIGAGWHEEEHRALGIPFPPVTERFERLEETLQIALQMWAGDDTPYRGKHYQLDRPLNYPQAVHKPHPPILLGGGGEHKTLRLVARYADHWNLPNVPVLGDEQVQHKLAVLRDYCQSIGRPYEQIEKSVLEGIHVSHDGRQGTITPAAAIERCALLASLGFDHVIFCMMFQYYDMETFDLLATEVIPAVEKIAVAGR
jgi:F420-dependent oxidoreductase-like protein